MPADLGAAVTAANAAQAPQQKINTLGSRCLKCENDKTMNVDASIPAHPRATATAAMRHKHNEKINEQNI